MIVVTGATGNIGRILVPLLAEAGEDVVAVSRRGPGAFPEGLPAGTRHARADVGDSASIRPVLDGAEAFFLLLAGELNGRGERPGAVVDAALDAGVKRIVLVSSQLNSTRPDAPSHARLGAFEAAVRASGADYTILRPGGFASNALAWSESVRARRTVFAPFGDVVTPVVDPADIAAVAAVALREEGHAGRTYELTGPEALSPRRQAAAISHALGEDITFVELSREEAHARMARFMPEEIIPGTLDVLGLPLPAEQAVSPDVKRVLHRSPAPFADWVTRNLPAFR
ncbi:SDR family oxidoreductase [Streptomyces sp. CBMA29]|uniref:SDR family oxidoreductase n=1 Tax=Streptomyces sp. CBMA29 TaxID=1896314 RepID=UPI001661ED82|nr:NAD(P)H-binding protein [Streptomyces sp. CBMA29]MBD0736573.1 NmrA family transcriptional regulator [Streptomyces sp. CBMA29]